MNAERNPSRQLRLRRPIVSFDLETTGLDPQSDRVVEICCIKLTPTGEREQYLSRVNPQQPIAPAATAVHGIGDADVADAPPFARVASAILAFCANCDLTGFNIERFDIPMLRAEYARLGEAFPAPYTSIIDSCRIFFRKEPRDLTAALRFYCGETLVGAHGAAADADAALNVLLGQVARYDDLPQDVFALHEYTHPKKPEWLDGDGKVAWSGQTAVLTFGKHRNKSLQDLCRDEPDYMRWLCGQSSMASDVKALVADALNGIFPTQDSSVRAALELPAGSGAGRAARAPTVAGLAQGKQGSLF